MNYFTSTSPKVFFTQKVVCERKIFGREMGLEEEADEIVGMYVILGPLLKRRIHGKNEILAEFKSEVERQKALEEYFGISLTTKEKQAINGRVSAIQESIEM